MRPRLVSFVAILVTVAGLHLIGVAHAQGAGSEPDPNAGAPATPPDPNAAPAEPPAPAATTTDSDSDSQPSLTPGVVEAKDEARYGVGIGVRSVHIPKFLLELFVEKAATSVNGVGFRLEGYRRKGNFELQGAIEYEGLSGSDGIWIDKGKTLTNDDPDFVHFNGLGWVTFEVSFLNHTPLSKYIALRYGGGAGIGVVTGKVERTDYHCTAEDENTCSQAPGAEHVIGTPSGPYSLPPVFPVINAIIGVQIRPVPNVIINVEGGIRTMLFFGATVGYYF